MRTTQCRRGRVEFESCAQTCLDELEELFTFEEQHGIVHLPAQPRVEPQLARPLELSPSAVTDIHMKIRCELDEFAPLFWFISMDEDYINISCTAQQGICIGGERARQIRSDDIWFIERTLLCGLF